MLKLIRIVRFRESSNLIDVWCMHCTMQSILARYRTCRNMDRAVSSSSLPYLVTRSNTSHASFGRSMITTKPLELESGYRNLSTKDQRPRAERQPYQATMVYHMVIPVSKRKIKDQSYRTLRTSRTTWCSRARRCSTRDATLPRGSDVSRPARLTLVSGHFKVST